MNWFPSVLQEALKTPSLNLQECSKLGTRLWRSNRCRHRCTVGYFGQDSLMTSRIHPLDQASRSSARTYLLPISLQLGRLTAKGVKPIQPDSMRQQPVSPCPTSSSDGESFHSNLGASTEDKIFHTRKLERKEQETDIEASSVELSSPDRANLEDAAGQVVTEQVVSAQRKAPVPPSKSPRKRCRYKAPTGPKASIPRRRSSVPARRKGQDLISFHRQSCQLFQSLEGTLASSHESTSETNQTRSRQCSIPHPRPSPPCIIKTENGFAYLTSTASIPRFGSARSSRRSSSTVAAPLQTFYSSPTPATTSSSLSSLADTSSSNLEEKPISPLAFPPHRPHPTSTMSWTSVESRRLEYDKIDRSTSGLRGFWKKITPRWYHGRCPRKAFFDGKDGEAESVRRYRISLEDDDDDDDDDNEHARGCEKVKNKHRTWSCLSRSP